MLASLLPGLREVRTPLAVGYLWFLNFWLWWGNHLPREVSDSDWLPVRHVLELSDLVGKTITLAAISFAAYLWGTLVVLPYHVAAGFRPEKEYPKKNDEWGLVAGRIIFSSDPQKSDFYRFWYRVNIVVVDGATAIAKVILGKAMRTFVRTTIELGAKWSKSEGETLRLFTKNRDDLGTRLLLADKELYGEYDRVMAEAQFRINVVPPLLALIITVAISADERPWWFWPVLAIATILVGILVSRER